MHPVSEVAARRSTVRLAVAALFFAGYALPLFWPPAAAPLASHAADASLLTRLFPTVPPWWAAFRLTCLAIAAALGAAATRSRSIPWRVPESGQPTEPPVLALNAALAIALVIAAAAFRADTWSRLGQSLFLTASLGAPLLVAWTGSRGSPRTFRSPAVAPLALLLVWLMMRVPAALRSPRCADPIDLWTTFAWLADAVGDGRNLLTHASQPGVSDAWMLLLGASLLPEGSEISFAWFQTVHLLWLALTGVALWDAATTVLDRSAAAVATAVLLFSPFFLSLPYNAAPFGLMTFLTAAMLALLARVYVHRSLAAATALGPVIGLAATLPHLIPLAAWAAVVGLTLALRSPRLPWRTTATAVLLAFAVVVPALPDADTVQAMMKTYVARNSEWQGLEAVLLGQRSIADVPQLFEGGDAGPLDVPLGALLAPFGIPRTPLRLWGDTLLDPIGAALFALGLAACAWRARHDRRALFALAWVGVAISPGLISAYDRVSLHRMVGAPVVWSMVAAVGYTLLRQTPVRRRATAVVVGAVAVSGTALFDIVNPRIVPAGWLSIALQANADFGSTGNALFLDYGKPHRQRWLHVETIPHTLPAEPIESRPFAQPSDLEGIRSTDFAVLYWSPALERDFHVRDAVCSSWPAAVVYTMRDATGVSTAMAAVIDGSQTTPSLPPQRWRARACDSAPAATDQTEETPSSVVLVVLDTTRADAVSAYGEVAATTPHLDALAADGLLYARAYANAPWTIPSHATLFSGLLPHRHGTGITTWAASDDLTTVAEQLQQAGFVTAGFSENPFVGPLANLAQGFATFRNEDPEDSEIVASIETWLRTVPGRQPLFLFVNLMDPHAPYEVRATNPYLPDTADVAEARAIEQTGAPQPFCHKPVSARQVSLLRGLYLGDVRAADAKLGAILNLLRTRGSRRFITIVTSDHGENLGEDRMLGHLFSVGNRLLHVPLVIHGVPGVTPTTVTSPVQLADVAPSILTWSGSPVPGGLDGRELPTADRPQPPRPILAEYEDPEDLPLAKEDNFRDVHARLAAERRGCERSDGVFGAMNAVIELPYKLSVSEYLPLALYDVVADPNETANLAPTAADVAVRMKQAVVPLTPPPTAGGPTGAATPVSEDTLERLRALGY